MSDPASDLNASVWAAMQAVYAEGAEAALFLPGDLPLITAGDVDEIALAGRSLTHPIGVPSTEGGTNALWFPACTRVRASPRRGQLRQAPRGGEERRDYAWARWNFPA